MESFFKIKTFKSLKEVTESFFNGKNFKSRKKVMESFFLVLKTVRVVRQWWSSFWVLEALRTVRKWPSLSGHASLSFQKIHKIPETTFDYIGTTFEQHLFDYNNILISMKKDVEHISINTVRAASLLHK